MNNNLRNSVCRSVGYALIVHTVLVVVTVFAKNYLHWETLGPGRLIHRIFRLVEAPVAWLVDAAVRNYPIPRSWFLFDRAWVAASLAEILLYGLFGGIFYSLVAAAVALVRTWFRIRKSASVAKNE